MNDGSPDRCKEIIKEYAKCDKRILLLDKENGGLNAAREAGIQIARGDYITIVDGDDFLETNAIELLFNEIKIVDADIAIGKDRYIIDHSGESIEVAASEIPNHQNSIDFLRYTLIKGPLTVCMKLYRASIVQSDTWYPNIEAGQDIPLTIQWAFRVKKSVFLKEIVYNYVKRESSATSDRKKRAEGWFESVYATFKWLSESHRTEGVKKELVNFFCFRLYIYLRNPDNDFLEKKRKIKQINTFLYKNRRYIQGRQYNILVRLLLINIKLSHQFVYFMQKVKPNLHFNFK